MSARSPGKAAWRRSMSSGREAERAALAADSVGKSYPSYNWQGRQWAFPIDAATQVQAWRPDLLPAAPATLGRGARSGASGAGCCCRCAPPHSLMTFFTLAGNLGTPCASDGRGDLIERRDAAEPVFEMIREIAALVDPGCSRHGSDRRVSNAWRQRIRRIVCAPLIYGYVSYAVPGFRPNRLAFADIPVAGTHRPGRVGAGRHRHCRLGLLRRPRMRRSTSPTGSPAATSSAVHTPRPAASPATPRRGRTTPSTRRRATFIERHGERLKAHGCGRAMTATWRSSRRRQTASMKGSSASARRRTRGRRSQPVVSKEFCGRSRPSDASRRLS